MAKEYHSTQSDSIIYHNNNQCEEGKKIAKEFLKTSKGNKIKLCENCKKLNREKNK